jgi:hypothetical protein
VGFGRGHHRPRQSMGIGIGFDIIATVYVIGAEADA